MWIKAWLYPGPDLNIRQRGEVVLRHLEVTPGLRLLDAGCGNGYFSFLGWKHGLEVLGVSFDDAAIRRCEAFRDFLGVPRVRARFKTMNLYDLASLPDKFDRIICLETLEHLMDDEKVIRAFWDRLEPGGRLIVGVPNLDGPDFYGEKLSRVEDGGHVRKGYSYAQLEAMLERVGFTPLARDRYGGGWTRRAIAAQRRCVDAAASVLGGRVAEVVSIVTYFALAPLIRLDPRSRAEPLSILVVARRA